MEDATVEGATLKQFIMEEVNKCNDVDLLDLVYKLLVASA